tara:strand:- start:53 stop:637 length:585 start_codon:yes stop_codon:yes gene_type:complete
MGGSNNTVMMIAIIGAAMFMPAIATALGPGMGGLAAGAAGGLTPTTIGLTALQSATLAIANTSMLTAATAGMAIATAANVHPGSAYQNYDYGGYANTSSQYLSDPTPKENFEDIREPDKAATEKTSIDADPLNEVREGSVFGGGSSFRGTSTFDSSLATDKQIGSLGYSPFDTYQSGGNTGQLSSTRNFSAGLA